MVTELNLIVSNQETFVTELRQRIYKRLSVLDTGCHRLHIYSLVGLPNLAYYGKRNYKNLIIVISLRPHETARELKNTFYTVIISFGQITSTNTQGAIILLFYNFSFFFLWLDSPSGA
jgi:hypothetical protein